MNDNTLEASAFEVVLASTVHDMKNSLGILLDASERITSKHLSLPPEDLIDFNRLQYEAKRTNNALIKLLSLYKIEKKQLPLNLEFHFVEEFLEEQILLNNTLLEGKNIKVEFDIELDIEWRFDEHLIGSVIHDVITNTIRYTESTIKLNCVKHHEYCLIEVADDGDGYPSAMVENPNSYLLGVNFSSGSTGLGLYFAAQVAALHRNGEKVGKINLKNGGELGGGVFQIFLP